jgi:hypothetical protein
MRTRPIRDLDWRQLLIAIWIGIWAAIGDHKALALRAVSTGFAIEFLFVFLWKMLGPELAMFSIMQWMTQVSVTLLTQAATGWVVARMRIPSDADQRSEVMAITIPN